MVRIILMNGDLYTLGKLAGMQGTRGRPTLYRGTLVLSSLIQSAVAQDA